MWLILSDRCWVVHLPFFRIVKFKFLAQFPVDHLAHPVVSSLMLLLFKVFCIRLLCHWLFRLYHHITYVIIIIIIIIILPDIGLAVRVFAIGPGDLGSIPGRVIPKTQKMVLDASLLNTQHYKVRIKGKVEQSRERSRALPYTLV